MKIAPEKLAEVVAGMRTETLSPLPIGHPRFFELLWFLQEASHQTGGIEGVVRALVEAFPSRFAASEVIRDVEHWRKGETPQTRAMDQLPRRLIEVCRGLAVSLETSYCRELFQTLLDFMDLRAGSVGQQLADTKGKRIVFRELEFARSQKVPKVLIGNSRIGKTRASSVWCDMNPGLQRLVTVPDGNSERDFMEAHADALHIEHRPSITTPKLRQLVEYVLRHSGLFLLYDEAQNLIPASYGKTTPPKRLNWIRFRVIDKEIGCAFFATPQSYRQTLDKFVSVTGFSMEQWLGRMPPPTILPAELDRTDLLAVAKKHFNDIAEPLLELIAARAMQSEGYLKNIELTAKRARFIAGERGHATPLLKDVREAIADMMQAQGGDGAGAPPRPRAGVAIEPSVEFPSRINPQKGRPPGVGTESRQSAVLVDD